MNDPTADAATVYLIFFAAIFVLIIIPVFIVQWILYTRAGQAGWKALIPVYGTVVMAQIAKKPMWLGLVVGLLSIVYSFTSANSADQSSPLGGVIALAYLAFGLYLLRAFVIQYDRNIGYWVLYLLFPVVGMFFANKANYKGNDVTPPQAGAPAIQATPVATQPPVQQVTPPFTPVVSAPVSNDTPPTPPVSQNQPPQQ